MFTKKTSYNSVQQFKSMILFSFLQFRPVPSLSSLLVPLHRRTSLAILPVSCPLDLSYPGYLQIFFYELILFVLASLFTFDLPLFLISIFVSDLVCSHRGLFLLLS